MWSFVHLNDAARATVLALDHEGPAVYNIVDDEPAPTSVWLPELARVLGAKRPAHYPRWLARVFAGEAPVVMATESRGASNAKAKGSWAGCFGSRAGDKGSSSRTDDKGTAPERSSAGRVESVRSVIDPGSGEPVARRRTCPKTR